MTLEKGRLIDIIAVCAKSQTTGNEEPGQRFRQCCMLCLAWVIILLSACESLPMAVASSITSTGEPVQRISITVQAGSFDPVEVQLVLGLPAVLEFTRVAEGTCTQKLKMPWMEQAIELPMNQKVEIPVDTSMSGVFTYACGMDMVFGQVTIDKAD